VVFRSNQQLIGLKKAPRWAASFVLGLGMSVFLEQPVRSHPGQEARRVRLGTIENLDVVPSPAPQPSYIFYPELSELGLQEGFSAEVSPFETIPSFGESEFEIEAHHLIVSASGYSLAPLVSEGEHSVILFFSDSGKLTYDGNEQSFSAMSYAVVPKQFVGNLESVASDRESHNANIKVFLTNAPYEELEDGVTAIPFNTDSWETAQTTPGYEVYNLGWTTSLDSPSGSLGIACSQDLMSDNVLQRAEIYEEKPILDRFPEYLDERLEDGAYELVLDGTNLYVKNFGVIDVSDAGVNESNVHEWTVSIVPPHIHDAAEIYTGYQGHNIMRLGENLVEMPEGALIWVPNNVVHGYVGLFRETEERAGCIPYVFPQGRFSYEELKYIFFDDLDDLEDPQTVYQD